MAKAATLDTREEAQRRSDMKLIKFTDKNGFKRRSLIKDTDSEEDAQYGVPAGPPDLRQLDMVQLTREMNNALADSEIWTLQDLQRSKAGVTAATNVLKRALIMMYREDANNQ